MTPFLSYPFFSYFTHETVKYEKLNLQELPKNSAGKTEIIPHV
jgi:hypothetical protein